MVTPITRSVRHPKTGNLLQFPSTRSTSNRTAMIHPCPPPIRELAIFDSQIKDIEELLMGLRPGVEAVVLTSDTNGINQISTWLNTRHRFDAIHIFATGNSGQMRLGNITLNLDTLRQHRIALSRWRQHLSRNGIIQLYCSQLGAAPYGESFVKALNCTLDTTIATSRHRLGGGRWQLDLVHGPATVALPLNHNCINTYKHLL